jgi:hypothetical protein
MSCGTSARAVRPGADPPLSTAAAASIRPHAHAPFTVHCSLFTVEPWLLLQVQHLVIHLTSSGVNVCHARNHAPTHSSAYSYQLETIMALSPACMTTRAECQQRYSNTAIQQYSNTARPTVAQQPPLVPLAGQRTGLSLWNHLVGIEHPASLTMCWRAVLAQWSLCVYAGACLEAPRHIIVWYATQYNSSASAPRHTA